VTVFLSSHLLSEVEQIAESVGILHEGKLVFQGRLSELRERQNSQLLIGVRGAEAALEALRASGFKSQHANEGLIRVTAEEHDAEKVNQLLVENGHHVYHVSFRQDSLEDIFLSLTGASTR
jgi:ABC-type multidrug transport system ATPase subunit